MDMQEVETVRNPRLEEAKAKLEAGVERIMDGDEFKNWLTFASKFHTYSANNQLLIWLQKPEATRVMGYGNKKGTSGWKSLCRQVRKGEQAIKIFAPKLGWVEDEETGERKRVVFGFLVVNVFDVSQTDGDPLPEPPTAKELTGESTKSKALLQRLYALCRDEKLDVRLVGRDELGSAKGAYVPSQYPGNHILLRDGMPEMQSAKTLCHEFVHYTLHNQGAAERDTAELEAEGTAYMVLSHFGIDTADYSFAYLAGWSNGDKDKFHAALAVIQKTASSLIQEIEKGE